jgi:hypothetical protein
LRFRGENNKKIKGMGVHSLRNKLPKIQDWFVGKYNTLLLMRKIYFRRVMDAILRFLPILTTLPTFS